MSAEAYAPISGASGTYSLVCQQGDSGIDMTTATSPTMYVQKPDGSETTWSCSFGVATATSVTATHTFTSGDIDAVGDYTIVVGFTSGGSTYFTEPARLTVRPKYGDPQ